MEISLEEVEIIRRRQLEIVSLQCFKKCPIRNACNASLTTEIRGVYKNGKRMSGKTTVSGLKVGEKGCTLAPRFVEILTYGFNTK